MQSKAATVAEYLDQLPPDRKAALSAVRQVILKNLDKGFEEGMQYGMIGYYIPHSLYPAGYHCDPKQPLPFAGLASQKNHMSVYLMGLYIGSAGSKHAQWFEDAWSKTGKKLDMGKACVRFKSLDNLALDVLGEAFKRLTLDGYVKAYEATLAQSKPAKAKTNKAKPARSTKKAPGKKGKSPARRASAKSGR